MFKTGILLLLIFTNGIKSSCKCYQNFPTTGKIVEVSNAFDANTFESCYKSPCAFVANSGDNNVGWNSVSISWVNIYDPTGNITIYDGVDEKSPVIATVQSPSKSSSTTTSFQSSTETIYIKYTQTIITAGNSYYGTIQAGGSLPTIKQN
ncbi:unnamed protein product [Caenorhabditis angaria]|uniref:DOMON domain-containing protein n=1 Tax=Caenorhabditis angaria TaxID=860376 RepID=A0A9P1NAW6_9PELO|nr:unnamed protein product [Caenorhabditis angaria]